MFARMSTGFLLVFVACAGFVGDARAQCSFTYCFGSLPLGSYYLPSGQSLSVTGQISLTSSGYGAALATGNDVTVQAGAINVGAGGTVTVGANSRLIQVAGGSGIIVSGAGISTPVFGVFPAGTFSLDSGTLNMPIANYGTFSTGATVTANVINQGSFTLTSGGTIAGTVSNSGTLTIGGTISGNVLNEGGAVGPTSILTLNSGGTVTGTVSNYGGTLNVAGAINGNVLNEGGGSTPTAIFTLNSGAMVTGNVSNIGGTANVGGTINGNISNGGGFGPTSIVTIGSGGTVNGNISNGGGFGPTSIVTINTGGTVNGNVNNGQAGGFGSINSAQLVHNGTIVGTVTNLGTMSGSGVIQGNLTHSGVIAPGNSIGTMTVVGSFTHTADALYAAEVSASGLADRINVVGPATLQGGTVSVTVVPGSTFSARTTYTLLNATAGVSGTYASVNESYPFLLSSLSYDTNNVYLTLAIGGFAAAAASPTQYAVGTALDAGVANASGDFATVLGALAFNTTSNAQGQAMLTALSGNNYAAFASTMVQGAQLFINTFADQTGGGGSPVTHRVALAEACDVACDGASPALWGAWGAGLGGLGTIGANAGTGSVTYNVGGFAAGLDRQIVPNFRAGVTAGYTTGSQWVGGFNGKGTTDTFQTGVYGNYSQGPAYADAIAGYAYSYNQMWRGITIPGLQQRTARGAAGANQFFGQVESGYRFELGTTANAHVTPFARLQAYTGTQNGFSETGAQSVDLTVAQQTTSSLRSVVGAQLGGAMDLGWREKLAVQFRLGWSHEYASTARPVTASFAGAPTALFTTYGVAPQRDGVVLGMSANTAIAQAMSLYLRYEGNVSGEDSAHALTAGLRMIW